MEKHLIAKTKPAANKENIIVRGKIRVTVLAPELFRIEEDETENFCDDATQAIWFRDMEPVKFSMDEPESLAGAKEESEEICKTEAAGCDGEQKIILTITTEKVRLVLKEEIRKSDIVFRDGRRVPIVNSDNLKGTYRTLD